MRNDIHDIRSCSKYEKKLTEQMELGLIITILVLEIALLVLINQCKKAKTKLTSEIV